MRHPVVSERRLQDGEGILIGGFLMMCMYIWEYMWCALERITCPVVTMPM